MSDVLMIVCRCGCLLFWCLLVVVVGLVFWCLLVVVMRRCLSLFVVRVRCCCCLVLVLVFVVVVVYGVVCCCFCLLLFVVVCCLVFGCCSCLFLFGVCLLLFVGSGSCVSSMWLFVVGGGRSLALVVVVGRVCVSFLFVCCC